MASLFQRGRNWYVQFEDHNRSPTQKQKSTKTSDKGAAREILVKWERLYRTGQADPWTDDMHKAIQPEKRDPVSIESATSRFLETKRDAGLADETLRTYSGILGRLTDFLGNGRDMVAVTTEDLQGFVYRDDSAASTLDKRYRHVKVFMGWAENQQILGHSQPMERVERPKVHKKMPIAASWTEVDVITNAMRRVANMRERKGQIEPGQISWRIYPIWFSFYTGLRVGEIARLRWRDVDLEKGMLHLRTQKSKEEQFLPISKQAVSLLEKMRPEMEDHPDELMGFASVEELHKGYQWEPSQKDWFVFGAPGSSKTERSHKAWCNDMSREFTKYRKEVGGRDGVTFHALRGGFCTQLAKKGANAAVIKKLARHKDISTSMKYIELTKEHGRGTLEDAFGDFPDPLSHPH